MQHGPPTPTSEPELAVTIGEIKNNLGSTKILLETMLDRTRPATPTTAVEASDENQTHSGRLVSLNCLAQEIQSLASTLAAFI